MLADFMRGLEVTWTCPQIGSEPFESDRSYFDETTIVGAKAVCQMSDDVCMRSHPFSMS